ncbi:unnamed protein product [Rotaria sp. Silwood1]|nr:unnamed protein product [Rotaria sp. Silwood1]
MSSMDSLYVACKNNDICRVRELLQILTEDELNEQDPNNRTALHVAALHGHGEVLELLLAHENINQSIKNQWGYVAKDEAPAHLKFLFDKMPTINNNTDTMNEYNNCVEESIEWFDTYKLAYRIAYENHIHLKRWLTKVSFARLVGEIDTGYIDKIDFGSDQIDQKILIKDYMKQAMEKNDPTPLVRAYTEKTRFVTKLNEDLANGGSDFRFEISFAMSTTIYRDNDPPKGFGHYIFVAILSHHPQLQKYRHYIGTTYRGMIVKNSELDQYKEGKSILTRTFLSSSTDQAIAQNFLMNHSLELESNHQVICTYHIRDPCQAIDVHTISTYPNEKEILIIPFTTFKITSVKKNLDGVSYIELDECGINNADSNFSCRE